MYVIRNDKGEFFSSRVEGEWGDGWGHDAQVFVGLTCALRVLAGIEGAHPRWIHEITLSSV